MEDQSIPANSPDTFFAAAGRDSADEVAQKVELVGKHPLLTAALNAIPGMVMILNTRRQIIGANQAMVRGLATTKHDLRAKRPGEIVGCIHPQDGPDGCGTSRYCATCGAVKAILESQSQQTQVMRECRIVTQSDEGPSALDLKVAASPIEVDGQRFIVVAIEDISEPKRKAVLERVFFHDVLNTAGCISGYADFLSQQHQAVDEVCDLLTRLSKQLVEEIQAQRDLLSAESGDLSVQIDMLVTRQVLEDLRTQYLKNPVATDRHIELGDVSNGVIWTDERLLLRILGNMLKNALEATSAGQTVRMNCRRQGDEVVFEVNNPGLMPEEVQLQMFQRSFSTKGQTGRGVGTYSMKLLAERYLGGHITFTSRAPEGTTFTLRLPRSLELEQ